jgi:hypothetical protein
MTASRQRRGRPGIAIILALLFLSLVTTGMGALDWKQQHSGVPARMTVDKCYHGKPSTCWGVQPDTMPATVDDQSRPGQTKEIRVRNPDRSNIQIRNADFGDVGREIGVHVHYTHSGSGTFAVKDGSSSVLRWLGIGCALFMGAVIAIVLRVRRRDR